MDTQEHFVYYKEHFNPKVYLEDYYGCDASTMHPDAKVKLEILSDFFASGMVTGKRLLDVGTGPSISTIISASRHFDEIYLSDFAPQNLVVLNEWWTGMISPLDHAIKYCLDIEQNSETVAERNKEIRDKVNGILSIDVQKLNPLTPNRFAVFDAIVSTGCLECASTNREEYKTLASNVASLLKKNGKLVITGALMLAYYTIGDSTFQVVALSEKDIRDIYAEIGFEIELLKIFKSKREPYYYDIFSMVAKKVFD